MVNQLPVLFSFTVSGTRLKWFTINIPLVVPAFVIVCVCACVRASGRASVSAPDPYTSNRYFRSRTSGYAQYHFRIIWKSCLINIYQPRGHIVTGVRTLRPETGTLRWLRRGGWGRGWVAAYPMKQFLGYSIQRINFFEGWLFDRELRSIEERSHDRKAYDRGASVNGDDVWVVEEEAW